MIRCLMIDDLASVAWLKDTRPLSEDDLQRLFVTIEDFEVGETVKCIFFSRSSI